MWPGHAKKLTERIFSPSWYGCLYGLGDDFVRNPTQESGPGDLLAKERLIESGGNQEVSCSSRLSLWDDQSLPTTTNGMWSWSSDVKHQTRQISANGHLRLNVAFA